MTNLPSNKKSMDLDVCSLAASCILIILNKPDIPAPMMMTVGDGEAEVIVNMKRIASTRTELKSFMTDLLLSGWLFSLYER